MFVHDLLEQSIQRFPHKYAIWYQGQWTTYITIEKMANRIASFLVEAGLQRGDRVGLLMENSPSFVSVYFGILKAGGVVVGLNTELTGGELGYLLSNSEARYLFISDNRVSLLQDENSSLSAIQKIIVIGGNERKDAGLRLKGRVYTYEEIQSNTVAKKPLVRLIDIDLAEIVYTSGSTGKPKGVMLSHLNLISNMRSIVEYLHLTSKDRIMTILPFTYIYGKSLLLTHMMVGGSIIIDNRFTFPNKVLETMHDVKATGFAGVPSTFSILLNRSSLREYTFPSLRYVTQAGGHMPPAMQKQVKDVFDPAQLYIMYGATEAAPRLSYLDPADLQRKLGSIGVPVPNVDLFVADEEGRALPAGREGELVARGANIMLGYWKEPEETRKVLKHGLYYTGDLGRMDEDGYLFIVGRKKDFLKVKGFRVSAKEVEDRILECENVMEAAVIGVPDPVLGEAVKAYVVLSEHQTGNEQQILSYLKKHLSTYKLPKEFEFIESLPKNKSGKVMKSALREQHENKSRMKGRAKEKRSRHR